MTFLTQLLFILALMSFANSDVFTKSFLIRIEDITQTNRELSAVNKKLNQTVVEQQGIIKDYANMVDNLKKDVGYAGGRCRSECIKMNGH